jgi:hypothetical protein
LEIESQKVEALDPGKCRQRTKTDALVRSRKHQAKCVCSTPAVETVSRIQRCRCTGDQIVELITRDDVDVRGQFGADAARNSHL